MKDKKLQVFVSSTYTDLIEERQAAVEAILLTGNIPAGMELFSAGDETQMTTIKRWIDESDVYLLILGGRYGSIEPKSGKSYTHLEYDYAVAQNKTFFTIVMSEKALDEKIKNIGRSVFEQENPQKLKEFRAFVLGSLMTKMWDDTKDIKLAILQTLAEFSYRKDLIGWVKGGNTIDTGLLAEEIARLAKENAELRDKLLSTESNTNALYSGLTYPQLEDLLKQELVEGILGVQNLFDFVLRVCPKLLSTRGVFALENEEYKVVIKLVLYKLVYPPEIQRFYDGQPGRTLYRVTESGHDFYVKALYFASKETKETIE